MLARVRLAVYCCSMLKMGLNLTDDLIFRSFPYFHGQNAGWPSVLVFTKKCHQSYLPEQPGR